MIGVAIVNGRNFTQFAFGAFSFVLLKQIFQMQKQQHQKRQQNKNQIKEIGDVFFAADDEIVFTAIAFYQTTSNKPYYQYKPQYIPNDLTEFFKTEYAIGLFEFLPHIFLSVQAAWKIESGILAFGEWGFRQPYSSLLKAAWKLFWCLNLLNIH